MKKFFVWLTVFIISVVLVDCIFGLYCRFLCTHAKGGYTKAHEYVAYHCNQDVIILGSSRATHHYKPVVLSDSLKMTCYNCGMDGNGILFEYSRFLMLINRYTPKVIIYDVCDSYDVKVDDHSRYLGWQRRYWNISGVEDVISDIDKKERYKLYSNLYRYNGLFVQMTIDNMKPTVHIEPDGYMPLWGEMDYKTTNQRNDSIIQWDELKHKYFNKLVEECRQKNIVLFFAYSPMYKARSSVKFNEVTRFCAENNIPLLDYYADKRYSNTKAYFHDTSHMNDDGATSYTKEIASLIKSFLNSAS